MVNHLLSIGINTYLHQPHLSACVKDVMAFKEMLVSKFDFDEANCQDIFDSHATKTKILTALESYSSLGDEDNLIVYYSGHGDAYANRGYWIPCEGTSSHHSWIPNEEIIAIFGTLNVKHLFVISDSCFSSTLLAPGATKSNNAYHFRSSRWALVSSFAEAYDSNTGNSLFAEYIMDFLVTQEEDFRISKLIEFIKTRFETNVLQTPQGAPLMLASHEGGEMIMQVVSQDFSQEIKGYHALVEVLQLHKPTGTFKLLGRKNDNKSKIGFELVQEVDAVIKKATYYLYLSDGCNYSKTQQYIEHNFPNVKGDRLVVLTSNNLHPNTQTYIQRKFKPLNKFSINDFIREHCTPSYLKTISTSAFLGINNFIEPYASRGSNIAEQSDSTEAWIKSKSSPLLVIVGSGGVGKTTYAQNIADKMVRQNNNLFVFFIDSVRIKDALISSSRSKIEIGLFDFYEAQQKTANPGREIINEQLFKLNFDAGNFLIVIDGLDEIISKVPGFDIDKFLISIKEASKELGSAKLIITCRSYFWLDSYDSSGYEKLDLLPFNIKKCEEFFESSFENPRLSKKATGLARTLISPQTDNEYHYHPYVLDIIRSMIELDESEIAMDLSEIESQILSSKIKSDYIIYRVCHRETVRIGQIDVDDQIKFLVYLANDKRGIISTSNLMVELNSITSSNVSDVQVEAFRSHPFIHSSSDKLRLKYDFLSDQFKSIYIANFFLFEKEEFEINDHFVDIVIEDCYPDSNLVGDIVSRISHSDDDDLMQVENLMSQIKGLELTADRLAKAISNIFSICLYSYHRLHNNSIEQNTKVLRHLFANDESIDKMYISDLESPKPIKFDFRGLIISNSIIVNYNSFYNCLFDSKTQFVNCELSNIKGHNTNAQVVSSMFVNCTLDDGFERVLVKKEEAKKDSNKECKRFLSLFFKLFYSNGKLGRQWEDTVIKPRFVGVDRNSYGYKKVIRVMKDNDIVDQSQELGRVKLFITDSAKESVTRYVKDGTLSKKITILISSLA